MASTLERQVRGGARLVVMSWVLVTAVALFALDWRHRRTGMTRALWLQWTCQRVLRVLGIDLVETGRRPHGVMVAANHCSYLDILVLAALTPTVFVAKREVRRWPIFGWFAARSGTRFIDRTRRGDVVRIAEEMAPVLAEGLSLVVFLEGTTTDGGAVLPFKPSLLEPAVRAGWPVVPAALQYRVPEGHDVAREIAWWGDMTLPPHLWNLLKMEWVDASVQWGGARKAEGDRKAVAAALQAEVATMKAGLAAEGE